MTAYLQTISYHQHVEQVLDRLLVTNAFTLDFSCIHPFPDGNGRLARLLTLLLLYAAGYAAGRYISLERIIERTKETYYEALWRSSQQFPLGRKRAWKARLMYDRIGFS